MNALELQPVKAIEKFLKPVVAPFIGQVMKAIATAGKLPKLAITKLQQLLRTFLQTRESSLKNYVLIGSYYISKRLLVFILLLILVLVFFIFIRPPKIVNKWFNRVPVLQENSTKLTTFSGSGKVVADPKAKKDARYVGDLVDGLYAGKGKLYYDNGILAYEGDFEKGQKSGNGSLYDEQGNLLYKGAFTADAYNGAGTLYNEKKKIVYIGEFQNGLFGGAGKLFAPNGDLLYEGAFNGGMYNGAGKLFFSGGITQYEGEFSASLYNGAGKLYDAKGLLLYEGGFKNGSFSGEGTAFYASGMMKYKGQFLVGLYNGEGTSFDEQGVPRLKGSFQNGALTGAGEAYDELGKLVYKGDFKAGVYEGLGTMFDADGAPLLRSFWAGGQVSLQGFIGLSSKKVEDLLGKPAEVTLQDDSVMLAGQEAAVDASGRAAPAADAGAAGGAGTAAGGAAAGAGAAAPVGVKLLLSYPAYQLSLLVEPSKTNPKEAVVTSLSIWGSKPLALLQPGIETFKKRSEPNEAGYSVLELEVGAGAGAYTNSYYKGDFLFTFTHFNNVKEAHLLQVSSTK
ncbi:MORN repeat-containing protein [Paenibacillus roseipurpureus]|uniref:Antitoxin component YwqK of the YwqJK toxin-antitoxin module n=1 Tax=Paenibacillus roseopurpureus TaxID=2918901 RepID=A0AA96LLD6_9BACL|nr:hypothetical protein [Paenibacillus sp. MBLB1832]WNR44027.1 hypothetical protein MJB10_23500 [Paenibacillus sp. MBLB1832]